MRTGLALALLGLTGAEKPVTKIVKLLKEIEGELKAEIENDQTSFDKMQCWCKKTIKQTEEGIETAKTCIADETSSIEANTGKAANAAAAAKGLEEDIQADQDTLKSATEKREKEAAEFAAAEQELTKAVSALKGAVTVLKKHQSFLQAPETPVLSDYEAMTVRRNVEVFANKHQDRMTPAEKQTMEQFLQQPSYGAYSNQSGAIFGILGNMLDQFTQDLKEDRDEEANGAQAFAEQKKLLKEKIAGAEEQLAAKNEAKAEADSAKAASEEKLIECQNAEEDLTKTLRESKTFCADNKAEFAERSEARNAELEAVGKAIAFLDSPEAFAKFNKAFSFVQVKAMTQQRGRINRALSALNGAGNSDLMQPLIQLVQEQALAKTGQKVDFSKVIVKIDDLVKELKAEIEKNTADKDACVADINAKTQELTGTKNTVGKLQTKVQKLEQTIADLTAELEDNAKEKEEMEASMKTAGENRAIDNANFQKSTKENKEAMAVLKKAKEVLAPIFGEFLQQPAKPAGFSKYDKNSGGSKVIGMLDDIIGDTQKAIEVAQATENAAQADYEKFQKDSNDTLEALAKETATMKGQKGDAEADMAATNEELSNEIQNAQDQETALNARKEGCKFLMDNFEIMQNAKKTEIEALNEAKAFLQGMK